MNNNKKLKFIEKRMGLNVLVLASILHTERKVMYVWMETRDVKLDYHASNRLDKLYRLSKYWGVKKAGHFGNELHRTNGGASHSLFMLLKDGELDLKVVSPYLDKIAQTMLEKQQKSKARKALLKKHGFEPVSEEEMADRLNDIDFL